MTICRALGVRRFTFKTGVGLAAAAGCVAAIAACLAAVPRPAAASVPAAGSATTAVGKTAVAQIEAYVQQQASADHIPGTAVGVVQGDQPVLLRGFGNATAATGFFLGSVSKSFTALAIIQLVAQGKVGLDAPVRRYIPWFTIGDGRESGSMTVLQLLDQTSGISTKAGQTELAFTPATTYVQAIRGFEAFPLAASPGKAFRYSDANYTIAGYIVQQASGQSYASYVSQRIFAPLGMTHTHAATGTVREPGLTASASCPRRPSRRPTPGSPRSAGSHQSPAPRPTGSAGAWARSTARRSSCMTASCVTSTRPRPSCRGSRRGSSSS